MIEIKLNDELMCEVYNKIEKGIDGLTIEDIISNYGIYVDIIGITMYLGMETKDGKIVYNGSLGLYDANECKALGFYANEIGNLCKEQQHEIKDFIDELLELEQDSIHREDNITEYDEILLALDDLDEYIKAMRELVLNGINGLPIVSLADECITICKDIENLALENVSAEV